MEKIRLGIIGVGNMGFSHAKKVQEGKCPDMELTAIADINSERLEWVKENLDAGVVCFDDAMKMLDSGLIDACIVAVPHYEHTKYAIECMKKGIHTMVEKPAGVYTKQVRAMNEEADKHKDVIFGMMFNQRTNGVYRKLREFVKSGKYGEIRRTNWIVTDWYRPQCYYDSGNWRATWSGEGGGVLLNQCPHNLDLMQWICGMPKKIDARIYYGKWHDIEVEDDVSAFLEYSNGATGVFVTSTGDAHGTNRFEIQMDKAKFIVENGKLMMEEYEITEQEFSKTSNNSFDTVPSTVTEVKIEGENPQHVGVLNAWANAILRSGELVADGREGINGLTLSNAMHLSSFLNKTIEIPFDEDLYYTELMQRVSNSVHKKEVKAVYSDTSNSYNGNK